MRIDELLATVARTGLSHDSTRPSTEPLDERSWAELMWGVRRARLHGLLDRSVAVGQLSATTAQADEAEELARSAAAAMLELEAELVRVVHAFEAEGIHPVVLKGPAVSHLDEDDPVLRSFADIDLLIAAGDIDRSVRISASRGYRRDLPERRPGFDRRYAKEISLRATNGVELDLHRMLTQGVFGGLVPSSALLARDERYELYGHSLRALDAEGRFVHACLNALVGDESPRLVAARDVAVILRRNHLDRQRLLSLLPRNRGAGLLPLAVHTAEELLRTDLRRYAHHLPISDGELSFFERSMLRAYRAHGGSNTLELLSSVVAPRHGSGRLAHLLALVAPSSAYRAARRSSGRPSELKAGLSELRGRPGRRRVPQ